MNQIFLCFVKLFSLFPAFSNILGCVRLESFLKTFYLIDSKFMFNRLRFENDRFGMFENPSEPSAPKSRWFGRVRRDSRFH